jgi:hypothetical protein
VRGVQWRGKWVVGYLLVLLGRRGREKEQVQARDTAAVRWRPAGALVAVALAEEDSRGGEQDRGMGRATRGVRPSRRWHRGGARVAVGGAGSRRQRAKRVGGARGRKRGEGPRGSFWNFQKSQGPYYKVRFLSDPKS